MATALKRILLLSVALGVLAFCTPAIAHAAITGKQGTSTSALVGWWTFDDGTSTIATDFSGRGNNGTLTNIAFPATATSGWTTQGKRGKALLLDNTDDYVNIGDRPSLDFGTQGFTIAGFVKKSSTAADVLVEKRGSGLVGYMLALGYPSASNVTLFLNDTSVSQKIYTFSGASASLSRFALGAWFHVAVVVDRAANTAYLYLNGAQVSSANIAATSGNIDSDASFRIGYDAGGFKFNGAVDEVRMYNQPLSASDVAAIYKSGEIVKKGVSNGGLIGWWTFDEGTSTTAGDASGNGNTGTLTNGPTWTIGKKGKSLLMNGSTSFVSIPTRGASKDTGTITLWANATSTPSGSTYLVNTAGTVERIYLQWSGSTISMTMGSGSTLIGSLPNVTPNTWYFITGTWNNGVASLYVNGALVGSNSYTPLASVQNPMFIGGFNGSQSFTGRIDDVRFYSRALSTDEMVALYKQNQTLVNAPQDNKLTSGLVGYWTFNGKDTTASITRDVSGSEKHATFTNTPPPTIGKVGQAFSFNGANQSIDAGDVGGLSTNFSVSAWIYKNTAFSTAANWTMLGKRNNNNFGWQFDVGTTGKLIWRTFSGGSQFGVTGNAIITTGEWHHVVAVHQNGNVLLYLDGVLDQSVAITNPAVDTTAFRMGYIGIGSGGSWWEGKLDEVRIYNRQLSAAEVKQLYLMGK